MAITTEELNKLAESISVLRTEEKAAGDVKRAITEKLEAAEYQMITWLVESNLKNYRSEAGLVSLAYRTSVKTPKMPEEKAKFYEYLREKGLYEAMISVNSATLNAFYKEQFALATEAGNSDFAIPGITEVTIDPILSFRKA